MNDYRVGRHREPSRTYVRLADELRAYDGQNVWRDVILPSVYYDKTASEHKDPSGNCIILTDGSTTWLERDPDGRWMLA